MTDIKKVYVKYVFIIYLIGLFNLIVLKFYGSISDILDTVYFIKWNRDHYGIWNFNLIPFRTIQGTEMKLHVKNIVAFIPMGVFVGLLLCKPSLIKVVGISFLIVIVIEAVQFFAFLGIADIDDVILNLTGSIIGYTALKLGTVYKTYQNDVQK